MKDSVIDLLRIGETYSVVIEVDQPKGEANLEAALQVVKEFEDIKCSVNVKERNLVPFEAIVVVTLEVTKGIAIAAFIKLLEKLWQEFKERNLSPKIHGMDAIQSFAEKYLLSMKAIEPTLIKRDDKGFYVKFVFRDKKGHKHIVMVSSFDLKILSYERK